MRRYWKRARTHTKISEERQMDGLFSIATISLARIDSDLSSASEHSQGGAQRTRAIHLRRTGSHIIEKRFTRGVAPVCDPLDSRDDLRTRSGASAVRSGAHAKRGKNNTTGTALVEVYDLTPYFFLP